MEEFSVLKTPGYPKYHGNITLHQPSYTDRTGYTITYYEPVYDLDMKIPGLGIAEMPFVPIQHIRSSRGSRPFVPRYLTEEDMIQINLRAERKAKDIMKDFHPAQKASYESARDFRTRKEIESRMEDIRESCANAQNYYRKASKYDFARKSAYNPRTKTRFEMKDKINDIVLDAKLENIKDIRDKLGKDTDNRRARFRLIAAGCKDEESKKVTEPTGETNEDQDSAEPTLARRSSRDVRAEQLKVLTERIKKQETEADCFERTFGRHLSKLRGEVNSLTHAADDYIAENKYQAFTLNQVFK
jgi:hypothetical protein